MKQKEKNRLNAMPKISIKQAITEHQAQVKLCSIFFKDYCKPRKVKNSFGKHSIEKFYGTYISQSAFIEAILMTDTKINEDAFCIIIEKQYREMVLFYGWNTAIERLKELISKDG